MVYSGGRNDESDEICKDAKHSYIDKKISRIFYGTASMPFLAGEDGNDLLDVPAGEIIEIMNVLYAEGKIRAFGGSNWTHQRIEEANEYADKHNLIPFTVSSPNFGLAEQI